MRPRTMVGQYPTMVFSMNNSTEILSDSDFLMLEEFQRYIDETDEISDILDELRSLVKEGGDLCTLHDLWANDPILGEVFSLIDRNEIADRLTELMPEINLEDWDGFKSHLAEFIGNAVAVAVQLIWKTPLLAMWFGFIPVGIIMGIFLGMAVLGLITSFIGMMIELVDALRESEEKMEAATKNDSAGDSDKRLNNTLSAPERAKAMRWADTVSKGIQILLKDLKEEFKDVDPDVYRDIMDQLGYKKNKTSYEKGDELETREGSLKELGWDEASIRKFHKSAMEDSEKFVEMKDKMKSLAEHLKERAEELDKEAKEKMKGKEVTDEDKQKVKAQKTKAKNAQKQLKSAIGKLTNEHGKRGELAKRLMDALAKNP